MKNIKYNDQGLFPAVIQDAMSREVLMLAWMNELALKKTIESGETYFWSRSRNELWHKGATSGNVQEVVEMFFDCDYDTMLITVKPKGPACHTGKISCFFNDVNIIFNEIQKRPEDK